MIRHFLATITFAGALLATFGAAAIMPTVMGIGGIIAAVAAILWGLVCYVEARQRIEWTRRRESEWRRRYDEAGLPYMRVDRGQ